MALNVSLKEDVLNIVHLKRHQCPKNVPCFHSNHIFIPQTVYLRAIEVTDDQYVMTG
jgi:hypothetical protein